MPEYQLPRTILSRLTEATRGLRNQDRVIELATYLARYWSSPTRLPVAFPVDRRAISAGSETLSLTEGQIRGALVVLEKIGYLVRAEQQGSAFKKGSDGSLRRKPILYRFAPEFLAGFTQANRRAQMKRSLPIIKNPREALVLMGDRRSKEEPRARLPEGGLVQPQRPTESDPKLEAALQRLAQGILSQNQKR